MAPKYWSENDRKVQVGETEEDGLVLGIRLIISARSQDEDEYQRLKKTKRDVVRKTTAVDKAMVKVLSRYGTKKYAGLWHSRSTIEYLSALLDIPGHFRSGPLIHIGNVLANMTNIHGGVSIYILNLHERTN